jgi:hypothetical protein
VKLLTLIFFVFVFSCSNYHCKPGVAKRFLSIQLYREHVGVDSFKSYSHYILIDGLSKDCDSATVMTAINSYFDNTAEDIPISSVSVFSSLKHFDIGETLSQPKALWGDCVIEVWFKDSTKIPEEFRFYNYWGNLSCEGNRWKQ